MKTPKPRVLYVDDEAGNLVAFTANFRYHYDVFTAQSAAEGKKILKEKDIHVIITDQRMPEMTGVQFLESIVDEFPFPIRILLTGYTDIETVIEAINKGQIYRYVSKPFNPDELKEVIDQAYELYTFRRSSENCLSAYRNMFENSTDIVFNIDTAGRFREINILGLGLFRIDKDQVAATDFRELFAYPGDFEKLMQKLQQHECVIDVPLSLRDTKGNNIEVLLSAVNIPENEKSVGHICLVRDITKQKEMENLVIRTIIETQEKERVRFGKNLHDSIGQPLAAIKLFLHQLAKTNADLEENEMLKKSQETVNNTIVELRNICFNIMPKTLEILGLVTSVKELCKQNEIRGLIEFSLYAPDDFPRLNIHLELAVFRIVQEFITNSITHGAAKTIGIIFTKQDERIKIVLRDDGVGFNPAAVSGAGMGLKNIHSRIQSYNGVIEINSEPEQGTEFIIFLPALKATDELKKTTTG